MFHTIRVQSIQLSQIYRTLQFLQNLWTVYIFTKLKSLLFIKLYASAFFYNKIKSKIFVLKLFLVFKYLLI
jgi:hypothetical protein